MIPTGTPGNYLPDIKRYVRPIDGFKAPDIADPLKPGERPQPFETPEKPVFTRPIKAKVEEDLLLALADPHASLIDVANDFEIALEALAVWMQRPDIAARLETIASASATRAVFVAKSFLPAAARSAGRILALHQINRRNNPKSIARDTNNDRRFDKTALHAGNLLLKIANLGNPKKSAKRIQTPDPASTNNPSSPTPPPTNVAPPQRE
ncbi:MAG: hypothetical protein J0L78_10220 [Planctomycetes bacterium]|nr:hypothetical protein [Planctomycetota bacterium]